MSIISRGGAMPWSLGGGPYEIHTPDIQLTLRMMTHGRDGAKPAKILTVGMNGGAWRG